MIGAKIIYTKSVNIKAGSLKMPQNPFVVWLYIKTKSFQKVLFSNISDNDFDFF